MGDEALVGHKVHPYGFRLGVIYPWKTNWYAGRDYAEQLHEDIWIRKHIRSRLSRAGISSIDIERKGDQIWVFIRTARPGIVIGRKGAEVDRLRKDIERYTKKRVDVKVEDMNQAVERGRVPRPTPRCWPRASPSSSSAAWRSAARCAAPCRPRCAPAPSACGSPPAGVWAAPRWAASEWYREGRVPAAHAPREGRLRHGRGEDHVRGHRREGLGLPRRRGARPRAGDRARAIARAHRPRPAAVRAPTAAARRRPGAGRRGGRGHRRRRCRRDDVAARSRPQSRSRRRGGRGTDARAGGTEGGDA